MVAPLPGCLVATALVLAPGMAAACTYRLGPASGTFAPSPGPDESPLVFFPDSGDRTPPSDAVLRNVETVLVWDPRGSDGASCPDLDKLTFQVQGGDERTPPEALYLAAYIAGDAPGVFLETTPALYFRYDPGSAASRTVTIWLGESDGRLRDGAPFRSRASFCFAVALVDEAGNRGGRSEAQCLNTTYTYDPTVRFIENDPSACSATGSSSALLAGLVALALLRARRAR